MIVAPGLLRPATPAASPRILVYAGGCSAALHTLLLALLVWSPALVFLMQAAPDQVPPIEVEMIQQRAQTQGGQASVAQSSASPAAPAAAATGDVASTTPTPSRPDPATEINLGGDLEDRPPLSVTSDNIKPPEPDSRFRNLPPRYPEAAASVHAEGTVALLVHVTSLGVPTNVQVAHSSGNGSLDTEARRAVLLWRFKAARDKGRPVPFDYEINIHFSMGGH